MHPFKKINAAHLFPLFILCMIPCLLLFPEDSAAAARAGFSLWLADVFPALFPFVSCALLLRNTALADRAGALIEKPLAKLFGLPPGSGFTVLMSLISGYPTGAKLTADLYREGRVPESSVYALLFLTSVCGPVFMISSVGALMLGSAGAGWVIAACNIAAAALVAILSRAVLKNRGPKAGPPAQPPEKTGAAGGGSFSDALWQALKVMASVCAYMVFFSVITALLEKAGVFGLLEQLLLPFGKNASAAADGLASGVIEMASGASSLSAVPLSLGARASLCAFITGFGGFCVLGQCLRHTTPAGILAPPYAAGKLLHGFLSAALTGLAFRLFPQLAGASSPVFLIPYLPAENPGGLSGLMLLYGAVILALLLLMLILDRLGRHSGERNG